MKATKLLIDLDNRLAEIDYEIESIRTSCNQNLKHPKHLNASSNANQQKLDGLFIWLDETLELVTFLDETTRMELDQKLVAKIDGYFSDFEIEIDQSFIQLGNEALDNIFLEIPGHKFSRTWYDPLLVFPKGILPNDDEYAKYMSHLDWRRNEKMNNLAPKIESFDEVITTIEITLQYIVNYRKGKWRKVDYEPKWLYNQNPNLYADMPIWDVPY